MNLKSLFSPWQVVNADEIQVLDLSNDSRSVKPGAVFLAYPGAAVDGRNYIEDAIQKGAIAIAYEPSNFSQSICKACQVPMIAIPDLKTKLAEIAARFFENPTHALQITGVTGTNGKTTVAYQLASACELLGKSAGYIGTIGQGRPGFLQELINTTPDGLFLQKIFSNFRDAKVIQVCMEVSSHALAQARVNNIEFNQAIYTNLSHEHLDYHHTMQNYAEAKAKLFKTPGLDVAIINTDDEYGSLMLSNCDARTKKVTYGLQAADIQALNCSYSLDGCQFKLKSKYGAADLLINGIGEFNVYNSLAIFASLMEYGYPLADVVDTIAKIQAVAGRMEQVATKPYVYVDYSHTPDALQKALLALNRLRSSSKNMGKIWLVFGCGGDRDSLKRPIMGKVASELADNIVITSDNPRTEDPEKIIDDIVAGVEPTKITAKIVCRRQAIAKALQDANSNDTVLIAGKGHEEYQIIGKEKIDFSDRQVVQSYLN